MSGLGRPLTPALSPQAGRRRDPRSGRVRGGTRRATDPARGNTAALILGWVAVAAFLSILPIGAASADKVMRVGMTASDIPTTGGIPTNGGEGFRFLGYPAYDALINWDFKHTDQTAGVAPGLATSWRSTRSIGRAGSSICARGLNFTTALTSTPTQSSSTSAGSSMTGPRNSTPRNRRLSARSSAC